MDLNTPLTYVKGIGPARAAMLEAKGLTTVEDLLAYVEAPPADEAARLLQGPA
jgi:predicted flap endonuclease-1-like 5' DNA nuclease